MSWLAHARHKPDNNQYLLQLLFFVAGQGRCYSSPDGLAATRARVLGEGETTATMTAAPPRHNRCRLPGALVLPLMGLRHWDHHRHPAAAPASKSTHSEVAGTTDRVEGAVRARYFGLKTIGKSPIGLLLVAIRLVYEKSKAIYGS